MRNSEYKPMLKILWLAPNFNHYKARFLNHLANESDVCLTILSGSGRDNMGDQELDENWSFNQIKLNISKMEFGKSKLVRQYLKSMFNDFDWILVPAEKKNLSLFLYAMKHRKENTKFRLFSYNHAQLKSKNDLYGFFDHRLTKFYNKNLDRIIYYSEEACNQAIQKCLVEPEKAFWANNTVDNTQIEKYYSFQLPPEEQKTILFIGRLVPSKRIVDVIMYFNKLKPEFQNLKLEIIGDGPEQHIVKDAIKKDTNIIWHGTLVDEALIAPIMKRSTFIFVPGLSGLSINHAFAYGRPYITLRADMHGPEISYLEDGENGYILTGNFHKDIPVVSSILEDRTKLLQFCNCAKVKGQELSVQKWVKQIKSSLLYEQ